MYLTRGWSLHSLLNKTYMVMGGVVRNRRKEHVNMLAKPNTRASAVGYCGTTRFAANYLTCDPLCVRGSMV